MSALDEKKLELHGLVDDAVFRLYGLKADYEIIRPRRPDHGCLSATAALNLGRELRRPPVEIAAEIVQEIKLPEGEKAEAMGKGFINFFLNPDFLLRDLSSNLRLIRPELPELNSPDFERIYPLERLAALLENQGTVPDGSENLSLLTRPEEIDLLWTIFTGDKTALLAAAQDFYDRVGLKSGHKSLDMARYILLGNALHVLNKEDEAYETET